MTHSEEPAAEIRHAIRRLEGEVRSLREQFSGRRKLHLTVKEVAELVGRSPFTVRTWIKDGRLNAIRVSGSGSRGRLLIRREELERLVADGKGSHIPAVAFDDSEGLEP